MRASQFFISTLKEAPADAEIVSHQLMLRAGMIKKISAGIYNYMPVGLRIIRKIEAIIREEMNRAGAIELLMPLIQPAELWQETQRFTKYGPELLRIKDRHQRDFVVQPTSEEVITDIVRNEITSYRQLPINFYHIQTKFRDERRPRFGVMRGREFTMKDAYSFDRDVKGLQESYQKMFDAYVRIFNRFGLQFRAVQADNGAIGGNGSHEFHVIANTGEDQIVYSPNSDYAANLEAATAILPIEKRLPSTQNLTKTATPKCSKCEQVAEFLNMPLTQTVKSVVLATDAEQGTQVYLILLRGDHELNEIKLAKLAVFKNGFRMATESEILEHFKCPPGYLGPIGISIPIIVDQVVTLMNDFVCGANEVGYHYTGVNWGRDLSEPEASCIPDIRNVMTGDMAPDNSGPLAVQRGIEVGHVFQLGTRYSADMNATYLDEQGKAQLIQMGCYGIGVTRIMGAAIEQNHDERGIIWPISLAPFTVVICPIAYHRSEKVKQEADQLLAQLKDAGVDAMLDDRDIRTGVMFSDWELIGIPHRVVISERGLKETQVEYQARAETQAQNIPLAEIFNYLLKHIV